MQPVKTVRLKYCLTRRVNELDAPGGILGRLTVHEPISTCFQADASLELLSTGSRSKK